MRRRQSLFAFVVLCVVVLLGITTTVAQVNTATLTGLVTDPQGLAVRGARVTVANVATGAERSVLVNDEGRYTFVGLVPGEYKLRATGGPSLASAEIPSLRLTVGENATLDIRLQLGAQTQVVTVTTESAPIETTRSESAQTVEQRQIDNLPINGRNYVNFTLINSQTTRDMAPPIGPAPTSGLNISGARARSNMVSVDGADAGDNSVNGIRATVSQEAVQEFQMILSNYNAEYGRATGGVVNIVTKSGTNDFHGDVFGYLRDKAFQARNPFSDEIDAQGNVVPVKQAYTRVQTGATFGGALKKDKTFYFFSYEYTQREETGFSSIGQGNWGGLQTGDVACIANPVTFSPIPLSMTSSQLATYNAVIGQAIGGNPLNCLSLAVQPLLQAAVATGASTNVAINADLNKNVDGTTIPMTTLLYGSTVAGLLPNSKFFPSPIPCPANTPVNTVNNVLCFPDPKNLSSGAGVGFVPLPLSYVGLNSLRGNFPINEKTSLWSARLDQRWSIRNTSFLRVGVSPSNATGIETTAQNQVLGENAGSRVGAVHYRDVNATFQHDTIISDAAFNEFRFQFARRGTHFGYSNLEGGSAIGINIPGYAYFGREPYSTVDRFERRYEFTDAATLTRGHHTFKFGGDGNVIQLGSKTPQIFQLDFGGDVNFGGVSPFPAPLPGLSALQAYGLGAPQYFIQGIGAAKAPFSNLPFAFFGQDTWRATRKLTLNYGVRYDVEISPLFAPASPLNAAAEKALGVMEGVPRDYNNVAPRFGLAWDPTGDGKTVVRAGYGLFYDHPLLAIAFDSTTADGARSVQLISVGSSTPTSCNLATPPPGPLPAGFCGGGKDGPTNFNGSTIFQGALNALPSMFYNANQQRFDPLAANSIFANQAYLSAGIPLAALPFTLPVARNFQDGYAQQANLTIERVLVGNWKVSAGYQWTRGLHLYHAVDANPTDPVLLTNNLLNANAAGLGLGSNPLTFQVPGTDTFPTATTCGLFVDTSLGLVPGVLGVLNGCPQSLSSFNNKFVGSPFFFNNFRPSGPNPSLAVATGAQIPQCAGNLFACGYAAQQQLAHAAGFPIGLGPIGQGIPVAFSSVDTQMSTGSSSYNALTINVEKRFSNHFQLLSSYTWSHSIDDSTDLQSTLEPQDSRFPSVDRGNSVNDQRHRWVTSGVFQTSPHKGGESFWNSFLSNVAVAPLIEVASGRPFNVITGNDPRLDSNSSVIRPSVGGPLATTKSTYIPGVIFSVPTVCLTNSHQSFGPTSITPPYGCIGNLARDAFRMSGFFQFDLRLSKGISFGERLRLDLIADAFNLTNHTNISSVNQLCDPSAGSSCLAGQPASAYDARQFQFALKLNW